MNTPVSQMLPPFTMKTAGRTLMVGLGGLIVWELFARLIAPLWIGFALDPTALIGMALGVEGTPAVILHFLTGLVFFPAGYVLVVKPLVALLCSRRPWIIVGAGYGIALWVFAMYVMASLLGGAPPFLGFEPVAWASLVGHVALGVALAAADAWLPDSTR